MAAYYNSVNDQGGVNGRKITFISYDEAYDPAKLAENARKLNELDNVPNPKIGTLMLNNDLANSESVGIKAALGERAASLLVETTFEPSQVDVTRQILQLREAGVTALITQGGVQT